MRAHYRAPIQDNFGNILPGTVVSVFQNGTTTLFTAPLWADGTSTIALSNPFTSPDGNVNFYLDIPQRIDIGLTPPGAVQVILPDIDVEVSSLTTVLLTFAGTGVSSTAVGAGAAATGAEGVAFGDSSSAPGTQSTAAGQAASAAGSGATAVGQGAQAPGASSTAAGAGAAATGLQGIALGALAVSSGNDGTALGANAAASGVNSSSLGAGAAAAGTHSTAVGAGAITTEDQQVRLGTSTDYVDIPNIMTMLSINAKIKFRFYLTDTGAIYTRYHYALDAANLLTGNDSTFDTGIGAWTAGSNINAPAETAVFTNARSTGAMLCTQNAAGPAYAISAQKPAAPNVSYVGKAWFFRHAGDGSATQFQAWLCFYTSGAVLIGSAALGPPQMIINDTWIVADVLAVSPSNAAFCALQAGVPSGGASADKFYVDTAGIFLAATDQ